MVIAAVYLVFLGLTVDPLIAADIGIPVLFDFSAKADFPLGPGALATVHIMVTPRVNPCNEITLRVVCPDHLTYTGPLTMTAPAGEGKPAEFTLEALIPADDTSGFEFEIRGCGKSQTAKKYWVMVGDSVVTYDGNPFLSPAMVEGRDALGPNDLSEVEKMHLIEAKTLPGPARQIHILDDKVWYRERRERRFNRAETSPTATEDFWRQIDTLHEKNKVADFDIVMDLRITANVHELARELVTKNLVTNLIDLQPSGYFRATASSTAIAQLRQRGIKTFPFPELPPLDCAGWPLPRESGKP